VSDHSSGRTRLEELLSPVLLAALDEHVRELVDERLADRAVASDARSWYTLEEAGRLLGCSYDAVRMRAQRPGLKCVAKAARSLYRLAA
jgi:hypothetical protein